MTIRHRNGSYDVVVASLKQALGSLDNDCIIVTDKNVLEHWGHVFPSAAPTYAIEPGEQSKSLEGYSALLAWCAEQGASRRTTLGAVGGGVVGDLGGFVAATYMRGIPLVQVPTTLLAQVDAAIGGKTAIDLPQGKNLAGAFYQPKQVWIPVETLGTLPDRQFRNGLAEVIKYGLILDTSVLRSLAYKIDAGLPRLQDLIESCIAMKARVVEEDEEERSGKRAILNFGHTIGHAIEKLTGYGPVLHGEAIGIGMVVEARIGETIGFSGRGTAENVAAYLAVQGLPVTHAVLQDADAILQAIRLDKKAAAGRLAFSLLAELGECKLVEDVPPDAIEAALKEC